MKCVGGGGGEMGVMVVAVRIPISGEGRGKV